jgi:hypothetical protein
MRGASQPVTVEVGGRTYTGSYEVSGRVITVRTAHGSRATQVGGTPPDTMAKMLLRELIREGKA